MVVTSVPTHITTYRVHLPETAARRSDKRSRPQAGQQKRKGRARFRPRMKWSKHAGNKQTTQQHESHALQPSVTDQQLIAKGSKKSPPTLRRYKGQCQLEHTDPKANIVQVERESSIKLAESEKPINQSAFPVASTKTESTASVLRRARPR